MLVRMSKDENNALPLIDGHDAVVMAGLINRLAVRLEGLTISLEESGALFLVLDRVLDRLMNTIFDRHGNALLHALARAYELNVAEAGPSVTSMYQCEGFCSCNVSEITRCHVQGISK